MIIIKVGGGEGIDLTAVCRDLAALRQQGQQMVLIHGGNYLATQVATALGHPPQFVTSPSGYTSRLTDRRTLEIFEMAYCGQINKGIVERLQQQNINAIGLSGIDGALWRGPRKKAIRAVENGRQRIIRDTFTGRVKQVNTGLLTMLLDADYLPVLTPPAISLEGEAINVDGDRAAAATAAALQASHLLILSDIPGVLRDFPDENSLIPTICTSELGHISETYAEGRMRIKLLAAREALEGGVSQVIIGSANGDQPIQAALAGNGTIIQ
jgi:acetylglutamate/LysW-gamma-L-alpha-aminoadipate kinase